jgi:hypothetical protein
MMKTKIALAASSAIMAALPLVAANVNGFEGFVLSRDDYKSSSSSSIANFSSRTRTVVDSTLPKFRSIKPTGLFLHVR